LITNKRVKAVKEIRKKGLSLENAVKESNFLENKWGLRSTRQMYARNCYKEGISYMYMKRYGIPIVEPKNLLEV